MNLEQRVMKTVNIGNLRMRVTVRDPTSTTDVDGNVTVTYADGLTLWAHVECYASQILYTTGEKDTVRKYLLVFRYRTDLTSLHRFVYNGLTLKPMGAPIDVEMLHRWTVIECQEDV